MMEKDCELLWSINNELRLLDAIGRGCSQEAAELQSQRRAILEKIATLPEQQRNVLLLRYDARMTFSQIAAALQISTRHVYRIRRAAILDE